MLFLHALPFNGSMWAGQSGLLPGSSYMPTLYPFGDSVSAWAAAVLHDVKEERLVVVGCSVGGSCALEVAALAPDRVAALVLIGTKAKHQPEPAVFSSALELLERQGMEAAWQAVWAPLFSKSASASVIHAAKQVFLQQSAEEIFRGIKAFHTRESRDDILKSLHKPITVITGAEDVAPDPAVSLAQADVAVSGRLETVSHCGHYVPLEKPDALNAILRGIIAEQAALL